MKLYRVTLKGFDGSRHKVSYALANDPGSAYKKVRVLLDKQDLGFASDRALGSIELLAESEDYPECEVRLCE